MAAMGRRDAGDGARMKGDIHCEVCWGTGHKLGYGDACTAEAVPESKPDMMTLSPGNVLRVGERWELTLHAVIRVCPYRATIMGFAGDSLILNVGQPNPVRVHWQNIKAARRLEP